VVINGMFLIIPFHLWREGILKNVILRYTLSIVLFIKMTTLLFFHLRKKNLLRYPKVEVCNPVKIFLTLNFNWDCKLVGNY
jgi:hypothetical protein